MLENNPMKSMAIIPARISSTRLKDKPLQLISGKPLVYFVANEVLKTGVFEKVCVATDFQKIADLFQDSEIEVMMTSPNHQSGTDRVYEVAKNTKDFDIIFNIQGDEPFIYKEDLLSMKNEMLKGESFCSLYEKLSLEDLDNPNKVKVLLNDESEAIYFTRFAAPFSRKSIKSETELLSKYVGKHIGLYAYSKDFLKDFCDQELGYHEGFEKLEQLRALQMGVSVKMIHTQNVYKGVDTEADLIKVNEILKNMENKKK